MRSPTLAMNASPASGSTALSREAGSRREFTSVRTSYGEIATGRGLQFVYRGGVEVAFEAAASCTKEHSLADRPDH